MSVERIDSKFGVSEVETHQIDYLMTSHELKFYLGKQNMIRKMASVYF